MRNLRRVMLLLNQRRVVTTYALWACGAIRTICDCSDRRNISLRLRKYIKHKTACGSRSRNTYERLKILETEGNIVIHHVWRSDHAELIVRRILALAPTTKSISSDGYESTEALL